MKTFSIKSDGWILLLLVSAICFAEGPSDAGSASHPSGLPSETVSDGKKTSGGTNAVDPIIEILSKGNDPFQFGFRNEARTTGETDNGLIPTDTRHISADIKVCGLLRLDDRTPAALLQLRPNEPPVLVRKGDLIYLPSVSERQVRRKDATPPEPMYLLVDEIRDDCVLVAPRKNPDAVILLR